MDSPSVVARKAGNKVFVTITDNLSPSLTIDRLKVSLKHYNDALRHAASQQEKSSALKNVAMASWKMAAAHYRRGEEKNLMIFFFKEALKHFRLAYVLYTSQSMEWTQGVLTNAIICWTDFLEAMDRFDLETRIHELSVSVEFVVDDVTKAEAFVEIANHYFHAGITEMQKRNYKKALCLLKECHYPLNEARRFGATCMSMLAELDLLDKDVFVQMCVTESVQARVTGDDLLKHVIRDEEILNIDMIWEITDWYRRAIMLTRENDLELEAIAHSRLGYVYDQILMLKNKAKENFNRAMALANLMIPRSFHGEEWFQVASSTLQRYQAETAREAEKMKEQEKEMVKDEIKEDLVKINSSFESMTKVDFLFFLYKNYSPTNPTYKKEEIPENPDIDKWKKFYCKGITHYHPDKVDVEVHGLKWKVLCEEITKLLTRHYEVLKCVD